MSLKDYWYGDTYLIRYYRQAMKLRRDRMNFESWLVGKYVYEAISRLIPVLHPYAKQDTKAEPYLSEPLRFQDQEQQEPEMDEEAEKNYALAYMTNMVLAGKNWGKR